MTTSKQRIRDRVLRRRGLEPAARKHLKPREVRPVPADPTGRKSLAMRLMEARFETPLEELLDGKKLAESAKELGVSEATISRWRKRLGLGHWSQ